MPKEELTVFAHLGSGETDRVVVHLVHAGLWDPSAMIHDVDASVLMTTSDQAKTVVLETMTKMNLSPKGETVFQPVS